MDNKQKLKPELKAIYEKIMNTPTGTAPAASVSESSLSGSQSTSPASVNTISSSSPQPQSVITNNKLPPMPPSSTAWAPKPTTSNPQPISTPIPRSTPPPLPQANTPLPQQPPAVPSFSPAPKPEAPFVPPPLATKEKRQGIKNPVVEQAGERKSGGFLPSFFLFVFFILYTCFWLVFFGVIDKSMIGL
jgi:hypothetical protein